VFDRLPEYPWEKLKPFREQAARFNDGLIDLSVGSPVDPTPRVIQDALDSSSNAPGYPTTWGSVQLREAIASWYSRRRNTPGLTSSHVAPTIGSKEFISWLPNMLGIGPGDVVVQPKIAYTAYAVGAAFAGAEVISSDDPSEWPSNTKLIWLNSPANPHGAVLGIELLKKAVERARELGAVIVNDECYAELGWEGEWADFIPCILDERVTGGNLINILSIYSLSKQSNLAGYRAAFAAGDPEMMKALVNLRMHSGMIVPQPVQQAMIAALNDEEHVQVEKDIYRARRNALLPALKAYGFEVSSSEAGLYLWVTKGDYCWDTIQELTEIGILAVPGEFYGEAGRNHVRFSITATDGDINRAAKRLSSSSSLG
jgi:succinyldiaminopimelate transaminase